MLLTRFITVSTNPLDFDMHLMQWRQPFGNAESSRVLQSDVYDFEQEGQYIMAFEMAELGQERRLLVSSDGGQTFAPAIFPGAGRVSSIALVDASEGMIFAVAQHTVSGSRGCKTRSFSRV